MCSWCSGRGTWSSSKKIALSSSSWCWPVWTRTSSWSSRSRRETAAALTNCGRLPMTVTIFTSCAELVAHVGGEGLGGRGGQRTRRRRQRPAVDGDDGLDVARGRGQERLARAAQVLLREDLLARTGQQGQQAPARDRVQDPVGQRRG